MMKQLRAGGAVNKVIDNENYYTHEACQPSKNNLIFKFENNLIFVFENHWKTT